MTVFAVSLGFMSAGIIRRSLAAYAATRNTDFGPYRHVMVDQHYPLDKECNRAELREICAEHGVEVIDPGRNLGLHHGFNFALRHLAPDPEDVIIAYDVDSTPVSEGWDLALVRALQGDPSKRAVWASLMNPRSARDLSERGYTVRKADGYIELWATRSPVTNSICAWRYGWLSEVGLLTEPRPFYGHLEAEMYGKLGPKRDWVFLPGWTESDELRDLHDRAYVVYKWCHSHLKSWDGDFESWLAAGSPNPEDRPAPCQIP